MDLHKLYTKSYKTNDKLSRVGVPKAKFKIGHMNFDKNMTAVIYEPEAYTESC